MQAGGGWVNDSEPEAEFQETVNKRKAMLICPLPTSLTRPSAYIQFRRDKPATLSRSRGRGTVALAETFAESYRAVSEISVVHGRVKRSRKSTTRMLAL